MTNEIISLLEETMHPRAMIAASHSAGIIAINKGSGLLSHPNPEISLEPKAAAKKTAVSQLAERRGLMKKSDDKKKRSSSKPARVWLNAPYKFSEEYFKLAEHRFYLCNRLDSATTGILIVCTDPELAAVIKQEWAKRSVSKVYIAMLRGELRWTAEKWVDSIQREERRNERGVRVGAKMGARAGGQVAKTNVRRIHYTQTQPRVTLVAMRPITGRTHQLRVQSQLHQYPIAGDAKYGDFRFNRALADNVKGTKGRLFLHSFETRISIDFKGEAIEFSARAPVPPIFWTVLKTDLTDSVDRAVQSLMGD